MRNSEDMKAWLYSLAHGYIDDLEIMKGFIKYYVLYGLTIGNVQDDIRFRTNYGIQGEQTALKSLNRALVNYTKESE